jgi:hypothetical protein
LKEPVDSGDGTDETEQLLNGDIEGMNTFHKCYTLTEPFRSQSL